MAKGMFVDTTVCIGCKACQVACKEWNGLDAEPDHFSARAGSVAPVASNFTGDSYDNTGSMSARDWRHVLFIEQFAPNRSGSRWLMMSDSCKHCTDAACLNVCPYQAIERTGLGNVFVRQDLCKGTKHCNAACPYGAIHYSAVTNTSHKCTLCNDRIHSGLGTACAKACPTGSITFGDVEDLMAKAQARVAALKSRGDERANLYGASQAGGLKVFYLLDDAPATYGLPDNPVVPQERIRLPWLWRRPRYAALGLLLAGLLGLRERRARDTDGAG